MVTTARTRAFGYGLGVLGGLLLLTANPGATVWAQAAGTVTDSNIAERITVAKTPADHEAIATYYKGEAAAAAVEVTRHEAMVKAYGGNGMKTMNRHCDLLLSSAQQQKAQYEDLAKEHAEMAIAAAKPS